MANRLKNERKEEKSNPEGKPENGTKLDIAFEGEGVYFLMR